MEVLQLSVFLENAAGRLADVAEGLYQIWDTTKWFVSSEGARIDQHAGVGALHGGHDACAGLAQPVRPLHAALRARAGRRSAPPGWRSPSRGSP